MYYMITTNVGAGNFFVKTSDPFSGQWSDPVYLPEVQGIDPAFFFDTDGKAYIVNNVVHSVGRIVAYGGREDAAAYVLSGEIVELGLAVEHMADLPPVHHVAAMEQRNSGKVAECGCDEEVIALAVGADRGVGIPSGENRVVECGVVRKRTDSVYTIASFVKEASYATPACARPPLCSARNA